MGVSRQLAGRAFRYNLLLQNGNKSISTANMVH
jgi:hypothetical protein